jgi:hypothetical protein
MHKYQILLSNTIEDRCHYLSLINVPAASSLQPLCLRSSQQSWPMILTDDNTAAGAVMINYGFFHAPFRVNKPKEAKKRKDSSLVFVNG